MQSVRMLSMERVVVDGGGTREEREDGVQEEEREDGEPER